MGAKGQHPDLLQPGGQILCKSLTTGVREQLEAGMPREELALRLGNLIDTIAGDLEDEKRVAKSLKGKDKD